MLKWCIKMSRTYTSSPVSSPVARDYFLEDFWVNYSLSRFSLVSSSRVLFLASPHWALGKPVQKSITQRPIQAGRCCEHPTPPLLKKKWNNFKIVKAMATKHGNFFKIIWELLKVIVRSTLTLTFLWQPSFDSDVPPNLLFCYKKILLFIFTLIR